MRAGHHFPNGKRGAVEKHRDDLITSRLNQIYGLGQESFLLDPELALLQYRTLAGDIRRRIDRE